MRETTVRRLERARRPAILASFVLGAAVAPIPDAWHQVLMAGRFLVIYEGVVLLARRADPSGGA